MTGRFALLIVLGSFRSNPRLLSILSALEVFYIRYIELTNSLKNHRMLRHRSLRDVLAQRLSQQHIHLG